MLSEMESNPQSRPFLVGVQCNVCDQLHSDKVGYLIWEYDDNTHRIVHPTATPQLYTCTILKRVCVCRKEWNVLFNDALNTFYLRYLWRQAFGKGPLR